MKRRFVLIPICLVAAAFFGGRFGAEMTDEVTENILDAPPAQDRAGVRYGASHDGRMIEGTGVVTRVLRDDDDGSRHQRFILELPSGQTLLVAHNIDLAPRVESIREGDTVEFSGQYETNDRGGVLHWTHHDPDGSREGGWLRHRGRTYR